MPKHRIQHITEVDEVIDANHYLLAKLMLPPNANDAWWLGHDAFSNNVGVNPYKDSSHDGFWYWEFGWRYAYRKSKG